MPRHGFTSKKTEILGNPPMIFGNLLLRASARRRGEGRSHGPSDTERYGSLNAEHVCKYFELQSAAVDFPGPNLARSSGLAAPGPRPLGGSTSLSWAACLWEAPAHLDARLCEQQVGVTIHPWLSPSAFQEGFDDLCLLNPDFHCTLISEKDLLALRRS